MQKTDKAYVGQFEPLLQTRKPRAQSATKPAKIGAQDFKRLVGPIAYKYEDEYQ